MMASLKTKTISSLFWKLFERGGNAVIQLVVQVVMARLLSPDEFGALAIMLVLINFGNVIVLSGLNTALVQSSSTDEDDCSTVFWLSFGLSILMYAAVFVVAPLLADFYQIAALTSTLRVLALLFLINAFNSVQVAIVQRALEFRIIFFATIASILTSGFIAIASAIMGAGLWALVLQQLIYQIVNCVVLAGQVRWIPRIVFRTKKAKNLFSFSWKLLVSGLLDQGYQGLSDLVIGKQFSASSLGLVSQGKKYPHAIGTMLNGAIQPVMLSAVAHVQDDIDYVKRLVRRALKTSSYLIIPSMTLFAVVAEPIVRLLLGEQWLPAVPFLQMYCVIYMLLPIHTSNLQALNGMGRSDLFLKLELIKKAYSIVFILVGAFVFQNVYVLVGSYILSGVISTFVNAWPNRKVIGYSYIEQVKDICPAFLLAAVSAAVALPIGMLALPDIATILLQAAVMAACYLGLSKFFKVEALDYLLATAKEFVVLKRG